MRNKSASTKVFAGLFVTFMNGSNSDLMKQIHASRKYSLNGVVLFDYAHLNDDYINTLTESVFKPCRREVIVNEEYRPQAVQSQQENSKQKNKGKRKRGTRK